MTGVEWGSWDDWDTDTSPPSQKREQEHQEELERQKVAKEKEVARLRAQQERAKDKQAERVGFGLPWQPVVLWGCSDECRLLWLPW